MLHDELIEKLKKQLNDETEEKLRLAIKTLPQRIDQIIDKHIQEIVCKSLGFEYRWGEYSVDHCNGRATATADRIGAYIDSMLGTKLDEWIADALKKGIMPKGWKEAMRKEFDERVERQLNELVTNYARKYVAENSDTIIEKIKAVPSKKVPNKRAEPEYEDLDE